MMDRNGTLNFLIGLGAGLAVGILYAPRRGDEFRRFVANKTRQKAEEVKGQATEMWDSANEMVESGRAELARKQEGVKQAVKAGKTAYQEVAG